MCFDRVFFLVFYEYLTIRHLRQDFNMTVIIFTDYKNEVNNRLLNVVCI